MPSPYRLHELGWLQFDRLSARLLETEAGLADVRWHGHSDTVRVAPVEDDLTLRGRRGRIRGPLGLAAVWVRDDADSTAGRFVRELMGAPVDFDQPLFVLTNLDAAEAMAELIRETVLDPGNVTVWGASEIGACLDRSARLRQAIPSVLGLRDLSPLIKRTVRARSTLDVPRAQALAQVFWPTRAYDQAVEILERHRFVVLSGPPEMGKTAIAEMVALCAMTDGWEAHECTDPAEVWRVFDRDRRQVFVADDAFGSTEYRPDAAERWARGLGRLLGMLDDRHWLIWTSRPAPLKAGLRRVQREEGSERFPAPGEVLVDAGDLDLAEKTLILFRHAKGCGAAGEARELLRSTALSIVEHPHFTPERIRRFVATRLPELPQMVGGGRRHLEDLIEHELASPTDAMRESFHALEAEHRELLISLLDAPSGLIDERELAATVRRHHAGGLSHPPGELIDRLTDHFLRITPLGIGWVHPSWRDLVIEELRADATARRRFLGACGADGAALALSIGGGVAGERALPLLVADADWDVLGDRLHDLVLHELEDQDAARVLLALGASLPALQDGTQIAEARSLATYVLGATRRAWDEDHRAVPVFLLEAWFTLRAAARERIPAPRLAFTWAELHPGSFLLEHPDGAELVRTEEWLVLAELLHRFERDGLKRLGFFDRDRELLSRLIVTLTRAAAREELRALSECVLARIEALVPELARSAHGAIEVGHLVQELERKRWWEPEDIAAPPTTEPRSAVRPEFGREDVARVLRDL